MAISAESKSAAAVATAKTMVQDIRSTVSCLVNSWIMIHGRRPDVRVTHLDRHRPIFLQALAAWASTSAGASILETLIKTYQWDREELDLTKLRLTSGEGGYACTAGRDAVAFRACCFHGLMLVPSAEPTNKRQKTELARSNIVLESALALLPSE